MLAYNQIDVYTTKRKYRIKKEKKRPKKVVFFYQTTPQKFTLAITSLKI